MNASSKDGLSNLLSQRNGCDLYGKFWLLQEFFYFSQMNCGKFRGTIRVNARTLVKALRTNAARLPTILDTFRTVLGIESTSSTTPYGLVYETTMPKALIYITKRNQKEPHKEVEVDLDLKKEKEVDVEVKEVSFLGCSPEEDSRKKLLDEMRAKIKKITNGWSTMLERINVEFKTEFVDWTEFSYEPEEQLKKYDVFIDSCKEE